MKSSWVPPAGRCCAHSSCNTVGSKSGTTHQVSHNAAAGGNVLQQPMDQLQLQHRLHHSVSWAYLSLRFQCYSVVRVSCKYAEAKQVPVMAFLCCMSSVAGPTKMFLLFKAPDGGLLAAPDAFVPKRAFKINLRKAFQVFMGFRLLSLHLLQYQHHSLVQLHLFIQSQRHHLMVYTTRPPSTWCFAKPMHSLW